MGLWHFLVTSAENPSDDFGMRLRKGVVGCLFFPVFFAVIGYAIRGYIVYSVPSHYAAAGACTGMGLVSAISFGWMRHTRDVSDRHIDAVLWGIAGFVTIAYLCFPEFDNKTCVFACATMGILAQMPTFPVYAIFLTLQCLLVDWNNAMLRYPDYQLTLPEPRTNISATLRLVGFLLGSSVLFGCVRMFYVQVKELQRQQAAQLAATQMTMRVLKHQRKYDTEEVGEILSQCAKERVVDPELIALFKTMNSNLENYRPFLPNYLFNDDSDDDKDGEDEGAISQSEAGGASQSSRRMDEASRRSSQRSQTYSIPADNQSQSSRMGVAAHVDPTLAITLNKRGALFQGRVTFALVDICADRLTHSEFVGNTAEILQPVVNMVYSLAKETKASVHSMLGDTVQLTWNATQPVALPETKGAVFLCRLARYFQQGGQEEIKTPAALSSSQQEPQPTDTALPEPTVPLILNAAVCSGKASVHSITSASTQQALIIEAPWLPSLEGCLELAKRVGGAAPISGSLATPGCVLMDDRTMKGSQLEVDSCAVEMVRFSEGERPTFLGQYEGLAGSSSHSSSAAQVTAVIHQLLGEHVRADDEWMYQLQGGDANDAKEGSEKPHLRAVLMASEGRYREALEALNAADETSDTAQSSNSPKSSKLVNANPAFAKALHARCLRGS